MSTRVALRIASRRWKIFLLAVLAGVVMGYLSWVLIPQQWESESYVEGGTIGTMDLEGVDALALRLRSPLTFREVVRRIRAEDNEVTTESLLESTRIVQLPRGVSLKVRAKRGEDAVKVSQYFLEEVARQQSELIPIVRKQLASYEKHAGGMANAGVPISPELTTIEIRSPCLTERPSSNADFVPARFSVAPSYFPKPVSPSLRLLILAGGLCGVCLATAYVVRIGSSETTD